MKHTPRFINYYFNLAMETAGMSYSKRLQVGCVVVNTNNDIVVTGYNGTPHGEPNCCEYVIDGRLKTHDGVLHAERNAISRLQGRGVDMTGYTMLCTHSPCIKCAELIADSGFSHLYYLNDYRSADGRELLGRRGVAVTQWSVPLRRNIPSILASEESAKIA
jgi:dCMP deaminase